MTLESLYAAVEAGSDPLLTYRQVAAVTHESYTQIQKWVAAGKLIAVEYGPSRRPRIQASLVVRLFYQPCLPRRCGGYRGATRAIPCPSPRPSA